MRRAPTGPKTKRLATQRLRHLLTEANSEDRMVTELEFLVPDAWAMLEADVECREKKEKVTLYLDASVAKFFRAMGTGYQARINRLLALYAQAKIAESRWFEDAFFRELDAAHREREAEARAEEERAAEEGPQEDPMETPPSGDG
jgi:uncharacterized protein (DUF4415 family)